jgi:hypothetical protein
MNFGQAIEAMKRGEAVARAGWNGKGMFVYIDDGHPEIGGWRPFVVIKDATDMRGPWNASQADMLAEDWAIVPREVA